MAARAPIIATVNGGEISRQLYGRADLPGWRASCRTLENMIAMVGGGSDRRPGTRFMAAAKDESQAVEMIPFETAADQAVMIEASDQFFRFYENKARIESPPGTPVEIATPYLAADLAGLDWAQSVDALYLVHPSYRQRKLTRTDAVTFSLDTLTFKDGPYLPKNKDSGKTLTLTGAGPWTAGNTTTMTAAGHAPFAAGHVNSLWRLESGADFVWVTVTAFTDPNNVTVRFEVAVPASLQATATSSWREGLWSDVRGYPAAVSFHEGRLTFGGSTAVQWEIDASASGAEFFDTFAPGTGDGDALQVIIANNGQNGILWLVSATVLYAGTSASLARVGAVNPEAALTPTLSPVKRIPGGRAAPVRPVVADTEILFAARHRKRLLGFPHQIPQDGILPRDRSLRADHIAKKGLAWLAWQGSPVPMLWAGLDDGTLGAMTFDPAEQVEAWHRHPIAGSAAGAAIVESGAVMPGANQDELWLLVRRTIGGATHRYVEVMEDLRDDDTAQEDFFYVDSGQTYTGAPATLMTGADHLEGETVTIYADGEPVPPKTVVGGQFTLDKAASTVHWGLHAPAKLSPMPLIPTPGAERSHAKRRIARVNARIHRTASFKVGPDETRLDTIPLNAGVAPGTTPPVVTGIEQLPFPGKVAREVGLVFVQDQPTAFSLLALEAEMTDG